MEYGIKKNEKIAIATRVQSRAQNCALRSGVQNCTLCSRAQNCALWILLLTLVTISSILKITMNHKAIYSISVIIFCSVFLGLFSLTANGAPVIMGIEPLKAVPGETVTVFGSELSGTVDLKSSQGLTYSTSGTFSSSGNEYRFEVSNSLPAGSYTISITSADGNIESPQTLTVNNGGKPFGLVIRPNIPTEGLPTFGALVETIFIWSLNILGIVVFVMIFFAGFQWFTAAGNTAKVNEARGRITNAVTGAIILLAAWIILYTINPDLVGGTFTLPGVGGPQNTGSQTNP